ncbi:hypothetical protein BJV82DRAFT_704878 [Fennellomyces sp. T-0311]|nr:hypothetical protein BJV82DRAFT_704878 [Fennellomyces sp. T-0311]
MYKKAQPIAPNMSDSNSNNSNHEQLREESEQRGSFGNDYQRLTAMFEAIRDLRPFERQDENGVTRNISQLWVEVTARTNNVRRDLPPLSVRGVRRKEQAVRASRWQQDGGERRGTGTNEAYTTFQQLVDEVSHLETCIQTLNADNFVNSCLFLMEQNVTDS